MLEYTVTDEDLGKRLDVFVSENLPELSRSYIRKLANNGAITYKSQAQSAGYKLRQLGKVSVDYDLTQLQNVPVVDLDIIYEDGDVIVINKPSGLITHNRGRYWDEASVASSIRNLLNQGSDSSMRAGIVHRLDRGTSGVLICAKNTPATKFLQQQFHDRKVQKTYLAMVSGGKLPDEGIIDKPIARNPKQPSRFRVDINGKPAQTKFKLLATTTHDNRTSQIVKLTPLTGRTHQLRVHLASLDSPIIGDSFYSGQPANRLMLHAWKLKITIPSGQSKTFTAKPPAELDFKSINQVNWQSK